MPLTQDQRTQLEDALTEAKERNQGESWRNGCHALLILALRRLGYNARSSEQAERTAERLLYGG